MASPTTTTTTTIDALFTSTTSTTALTLLSTLQMLTPLLESYFFSFELRTLLTVDKRTGALAHAYLNKTFQQTWWKKDDDAMRRKIREELDHLHTIRTSPSHTRRTPQDQSSLNTQLRAYFLNTFTCTHTLHIPDSTADTMTTSEYFDMVQDQMEKDRVIENLTYSYASHYAHLHSLIMKEGAQLQLPRNLEENYTTGGVVFRRREQQVAEQKGQVRSYPAPEAATSFTSSDEEPIHTQNLADFGRQIVRICLVTQEEYVAFQRDPDLYHARKHKLSLLLSLLRLLLLSNPSLRHTSTSIYAPEPDLYQTPRLRRVIQLEELLYHLVLVGNVFSENKTQVEMCASVESKSRWYFKKDHWLLTELVYDVAVWMRWFTLFVQVEEEMKEERKMEKRRLKEEEKRKWKEIMMEESGEEQKTKEVAEEVKEEKEKEEEEEEEEEVLDEPPLPPHLHHTSHIHLCQFLATTRARPNSKLARRLLEGNDDMMRAVSLCDEIEIHTTPLAVEEHLTIGDGDLTNLAQLSHLQQEEEEEEAQLLLQQQQQQQQCEEDYELLKRSSGQLALFLFSSSGIRSGFTDKKKKKNIIPRTPSRYTRQLFHTMHQFLLRTMLHSLRTRADPATNKQLCPHGYDISCESSAEERGSFDLNDLPHERYDLLEILFSTKEFRDSFRRTLSSFASRYMLRALALRANYASNIRSYTISEAENPSDEQRAYVQGKMKRLMKEYGQLWKSEEEATRELHALHLEIQENKPEVDFVILKDLQKMIKGFFASKGARRSFGRLLTRGWIRKALDGEGEMKEKKEVVLCQATQAAMKKTRELMEEIARKKHENHATSSSISASSLSSSSSTSAPSTSTSSTSSIPPSSLYHRFLSFLYFDCIRRKDVFLLRTLTQLMLREDNFHAAALYDVETGESPLHYMERHAFGKSRWRIFEILLNSAVQLHFGNVDAVLNHTNVYGEVTFRELVRKNWNRDLKERLEEQYPHVII